MSVLHRLTRTVRPASLNPATILRSRVQAARTTPSQFCSPHPIHRLGLGHRFHSSYAHDISANLKILYAMIGLNTGIFLYGQYAKTLADRGFPEKLDTFSQNMTLNLDSVMGEGRWWTIVTSCFAHLNLLHLGGNMISTYYLGDMLARTRGFTPAHFLILIFGSGITGSVGYLYVRYRNITNGTSKKDGDRPRDVRHGLGFSGAVMGAGAVAAVFYPRVKMLIYGIVPMLW